MNPDNALAAAPPGGAAIAAAADSSPLGESAAMREVADLGRTPRSRRLESVGGVH